MADAETTAPVDPVIKTKGKKKLPAWAEEQLKATAEREARREKARKVFAKKHGKDALKASDARAARTSGLTQRAREAIASGQG